MNRHLKAFLASFFLFLPQAPLAARDFSEATIADIQAGMYNGAFTAEQLVGWYLDRIAEIDWGEDGLRSIIEVNPDAIDIAREMDSRRNELSLKGPLYGIPVVLKANIDTGDKMSTSAGSLALAHHHLPDDAFLVRKLREAGAIILGKANLSEWANFRSSHSTSGWSSVGGQTRNPYDTSRNPCGSSSGSAVAVAANLTLLAVGTETDGSVVCPAGQNGVVGIKPSLGLVSRDGIIPVAHSQDTAGPMARTVRDAAMMLAMMAGPDPNDPITVNALALNWTLVDGLSADALNGKRIGVLRTHFGADSDPNVEAILQTSIRTIESLGATVVDGIEIDFGAVDRSAEWEVLLYEFKADLNKYLKDSGAPYASLAALIEFNKSHADKVMPHFGQDIFLAAQEKGPLTEAAYLDTQQKVKSLTRLGIDQTLARHKLDALMAPTNSPAWLTDHVNGDHFRIGSSSHAAMSGYPNVTVPAGFVSGLPVGVSFSGAKFSDAKLIAIAYAFEQAAKARIPPKLP